MTRTRMIQVPVMLLSIAILLPIRSWAATVSVANDSYISSLLAAQSFGGNDTLNVDRLNSALISLDLSSLPSGLTATNIQKATLTVFLNKVVNAGGVDIAQVTSQWSESAVTYSTKPSTAPPFLNNVAVGTSGSYLTIDITTLMQQWLGGTTANYGIAITASAGNPASVRLDSKESSSTSQAAYAEVSIVSLGPVGATGATGGAGPAGLPGPQGPVGLTGIAGPAGIRGAQGPVGATGAVGSVGVAGIQGVVGPTGPAGAPSNPGLKGRGNFSPTTAYSIGDTMSDLGNTYVALTNSTNAAPGTPAGITAWGALAMGGAHGTDAAYVANFQNANCPSGQNVTGFDQNGGVTCAVQTCPALASFVPLILSKSVYYDFPLYAIYEVWPTYTVNVGSGNCTASIKSPVDSSGNTCLIDHTRSCNGWSNLTWSSGFSSCSYVVTDPDCNSAAAIPRTDGTFPACSVATSTGPHSTAGVVITCLK